MLFSCLLVVLPLDLPLFAVLAVSSVGVDVLSELKKADLVILLKDLQIARSASLKEYSSVSLGSLFLFFTEFFASSVAFSLFLFVLSSLSLLTLFAAVTAENQDRDQQNREEEDGRSVLRIQKNFLEVKIENFKT